MLIIFTISVVAILLFCLLIMCSQINKYKRKAGSYYELSRKHLEMFHTMNQWVRIIQDEKSIPVYLEKKGFKRIAIYGMGFIGETLYDELKDTPVKVIYGIDGAKDKVYADIPLFYPDDELPKIDAVIVTSIYYYEDIKKKLEHKVICPILSFELMLYDI